MREIDATNAENYLRETGRVPGDLRINVRELSGGVSNIVLRVDVEGAPSYVVKQCREQLRVAMEWKARLDRIWAELAALELMGSILPKECIPSILFVDRPNYLFAMTCAPDDSETWKSRLMSGEANPSIAAELGSLLARIHRDARSQPILSGELADTTLFDELRVDPYYRTTARAHPELANRFNELIDTMEALPESARSLVLGDFSPKNILVHSRGLILLDFECAHRGDRTFDLGFFSSHLLLKTLHFGRKDPQLASKYAALGDAFWSSYLKVANQDSPSDDQALLVSRGMEHTSACLLARVDGKSPVEYLDDAGRSLARRLALELFSARPRSWAHVQAIRAQVQGYES